MSDQKHPRGQHTRGFGTHDHTHCIADAMATAESACDEMGLRLTPIRRHVLTILLEEHRALGAYDILNRLRVEGVSGQPPLVYRALAFLTKNGFAHKIERLNAFVACTVRDCNDTPAFLICRSCDAVAEAPAAAAASALSPSAISAGFAIEATVIEAEGLCPRCQTTSL